MWTDDNIYNLLRNEQMFQIINNYQLQLIQGRVISRHILFYDKSQFQL